MKCAFIKPSDDQAWRVETGARVLRQCGTCRGSASRGPEESFSPVCGSSPRGRWSLSRFLYAGLSPYRRAALAIAMALVLVLLGRVLQEERWAQILLASCGFLVTWFGTLWLGLGLQKKLLRHYGRFVLPGESLVVVQATEADTPDVIEVLRRIAHPSVFAIRPGLRLGSSRQPDETLREPVTLASLPDCAAELAASHQLDVIHEIAVAAANPSRVRICNRACASRSW